jgi:hypothetical protein
MSEIKRRPALPEMTAYAAQIGGALVGTAQRINPTDQIVEEDEGPAVPL